MITNLIFIIAVLGLLSEGGSNAYQTSHFDCSPGTSQDPTYVGHVTALGYMEVLFNLIILRELSLKLANYYGFRASH